MMEPGGLPSMGSHRVGQDCSDLAAAAAARGKESSSAGDLKDSSLIPELERSPEGGNGNPFQYSCLGNPMDSGVWRATIHGVTKSRTWHSTCTLLEFLWIKD